MGDVLAYEAELLGLVKEVGFLSLFLLVVVVVEMILARQVFAFRARHCN